MPRIILPLLVLALAAAGCTPAGPVSYKISGTITLDGEPLKDGTIFFKQADNLQAVSPISIKDGKYSGQVFPGKMYVAISAKKVIGQRKVYDTPDSPVKDVTEEALPDQYNKNTSITYEVKRGDNTFDYDVKTK